MQDPIFQRLLKLHPKFSDLSLGRIKKLLKKINFDESLLPKVIHIAGTNGKGSTAAILKSILNHHGYSTHVYSTPHLVKFNERIQLRSKDISNQKLLKYLRYCENMNKESQNAILKTLEEPSINTFIIMTSGKRRSLNQTIYSRCNKILIRDLDQNEVTDWIKSQGINDFNFYDYPSYISPIDILKSINNGRANDFLEFNRVLIDFFLKNDNTNQSLKKILEIDLSVSNKINSIVDILVSLLKSKQIDKYFSGKLKELNQLQFSSHKLSELIDELNELRDMHNKVSGLNEKHTLKYFIFKIDSIIK